jgi:hypothetical protein
LLLIGRRLTLQTQRNLHVLQSGQIRDEIERLEAERFETGRS